MKQVWMIMIVSVALYGCTGLQQRRVSEAMTNPANGLVQVKEVNGYRFGLNYLPQPEQQEEWCFRLKVQVPPDVTLGNAGESQAASFGVDTLFRLIADGDTLSPVHAMRIPNGNIGGLEYMLIFPRKKFSKDNAIIGFSDRLFSNNYLEFPIRFSAIDKIDSLSTRI